MGIQHRSGSSSQRRTDPAPTICSTSATESLATAGRGSARDVGAHAQRRRRSRHVELERDPPVAAMAREQLARAPRRSAGRAAAPTGGSPPRASAARDAVERQRARSREPRRLVVALELAAHQHASRRPRSSEPCLRTSRGTPRPRRRRRVLEHEDRHAVALRVFSWRQAARRCRRPRRPALATPVELARLAPRRRTPSASLGVALDRMAAQVEAERFLLERELLALGPGRRVGQRHAATRRSPSSRRAAEQLMPGPCSRSR